MNPSLWRSLLQVAARGHAGVGLKVPALAMQDGAAERSHGHIPGDDLAGIRGLRIGGSRR